MELEGVLAATFCPRDGHMSPEAVVQGYAAAAVARGAQVFQGCPAIGIERSGDRITGVRTAQGTIATDTVVCAAGAWAREVGAMVGLEIPVHGEPRHMWFSPERGGLREDLPLTIDFTTSFYFHAEGPGIVFGGREVEIEEIAEHALERLPLILELPIQSNWWGYYEVSPDHNAIVGESTRSGSLPLRDRLLGARLPAVAGRSASTSRNSCAASVPSFDLSPFALERFARGEQRAERFVV